MNNSIEKCKKDNNGFSVITVIVAIAFIGILAMLVLYISTANFQMKMTDLKAKDSFYTAENALDEIRTGLQTEVAEAMSDAYVEVLENYTDETSSNVESLDTIRQKAFQDKYLLNLRGRLQGTAPDNQYDMKKISGYVDMEKHLSSDESLIIVNPQDKKPVMTKGGTKSGIVLKNLKVIYVDSKGHASIIETDIRLGMPEVTFPTPSTLPDLMNMIVVANKGIIFVDDDKVSEKPIKINGSIYAGQDIDEKGVVGNDAKSIDIKEYTKVTVESGERLVCLGEIHVAAGAEFRNNSGNELWAQGIKVTSGTVELTGKTYLSDDLTLDTTTNRSTGSSVKISGSFYGYGDPVSARSSYFGYNSIAAGEGHNKYDNWTDTALSSSIIVNGKGSTLDLSDVSAFLLAGNSYIGSSKINADAGKVGGNSNGKDVLTGESLTVKGNQLAYLVPSDCFKNNQYTNPMTYDTYSEIGEDDINLLFDLDKPIDIWSGESMNSIGLNSSEPVQKVFYTDSFGGFVYFYLNFDNAENASKYFDKYYNNPSIKDNMDKYLQFYLGGEGKGIFMKDKSAFLRYVTKGNILTYSGENGQGHLESIGNDNNDINGTQKYQNMWYALTRKMIPSYDLLKEDVRKDQTGEPHNERDPERYVYDNLVDEESLIEFLGKENRYKFEADSGDEKLSAYIVNEEKFSITKDIAENTRLVVSTGDVIIEENVDFYGIIMAKGYLTMKSGSSLSSKPLEAAKVFQKQREDAGSESASGKAPMDFFWDGDKYILGNSIIQSNNDSETKIDFNNIYDLAKCITYENWAKK